MKHWNITVSGAVQGVYFRVTTKAVADQLGLKGYVTNLPDGQVFMEAEGPLFALEALLDFCHEGPDRAQVTHVVYEEAPVQGYQNFTINKKRK